MCTISSASAEDAYARFWRLHFIRDGKLTEITDDVAQRLLGAVLASVATASVEAPPAVQEEKLWFPSSEAQVVIRIRSILF